MAGERVYGMKKVEKKQTVEAKSWQWALSNCEVKGRRGRGGSEKTYLSINRYY